MQLFKIIVDNTSSQIASRIISSGTTFLVVIFIARSFGIGGYSDLAKITAFVSLFYFCIDLGANAIFLQFEKHEQNFAHLLSYRLLISFFIFLVIAVIAALLPYNSQTTSGYPPIVKIGIILFSLSLFSRAIIYSVAAIFQQNLSYNNATQATFFGSFTTLLFVTVSILVHATLLWIVGAYIVGGFVESLVAMFLSKQTILFHFPPIEFVKKIFWSTLPLTILLFLNLIYFRIDVLLLSFFQKASAVGLYDFAYKFFDFLIALPLFLSNSLYPLLIRAEKNSRISKKKICTYAMFFFFLGLLLIPFVWILSPLIIFVKQDFFPSVLPLRLLSLSLPIFFATNILQWIFITKKKQKLLVYIYGVSLLINIVLNLVFIPAFSYNASALITGLSEFFVLIAMIGFLFIYPI